MSRWIFLFIIALLPALAHQAGAQVLLSQYEFDSDLTNAQVPTADNGNVAPDGTFREGTDSATAPAGTATFTVGVDGLAGRALLLDGVDDWIDITTDGHPGPQTGTDFINFGPGLVSGTVMAWVKVESPLQGVERWLMGNVGSVDEDFQSFRMGWDGSQLEMVAVTADDPSSQFAIRDETHNQSWADGDWHHLAITWDGFFNSGNVYIDGIAVGPPVSPGATLSSASGPPDWQFPMAIGARNSLGTLNGFWEGAIDDLRIYGDQLTDNDILEIFESVSVAVEPDFNNDDQVDGADFLTWQRGVPNGTTFEEGDANGDMMVDATDLDIWKAAYGNVTPGISTAQAVPEPASMMLVALGTLAFLRRELGGARHGLTLLPTNQLAPRRRPAVAGAS